MMKVKQTKRDRMMTSLLAFVLLCASFFSKVPTVFAAEESETIKITTAQEFSKLAEQCSLDTWSQGKTFVLQEDIALDDVEYTAIPTFGGVFDGNGHTISGLKITQSRTPSGLFGILQENAVVKNLKVSGEVLPSGDSEYVGGIVGENYGMIMDCTFTGNVAGESMAGGIAGTNAATGQILACKVSGSVVGDKMTGGIAGCNMGIIGTCQNNAYVNTISVDPQLSPEDIKLDFSLDVSRLSSMDTSMISSDTGGIAGYSSGIVTGCINNAPIGYPHIGYNVGGIIGRNCGYLHNCENNADVFGRKDVGGIAGQMEPYIALNIVENTLAKLERQFDELDGMLTTSLNDANAGVGTVTSRLSRIADYMDSAAGAARNIRTYGSVTSTVTGGAQADSNGSASATPPQVEVEGSSETAGGAGAVTTPIGGVTGGGVASEGEIQGSMSEGSAQGEHHTSASGNVSASTQITMTTNLSGLSSAISGMSGQMRLLNGEISGTSGTLTEDLQAIQQQINDISDTAMELFQGDGEGDILVDSSEVDIDLATLGKASGCTNSGNVNGDINVGGITGAMAMEYELEPEDDITSNLDEKQRRKLEIKAIIQKCVNTGEVTARRSYAGGICGRMDLGLTANSEAYGSVTSENGDYVGGIAGVTASTVRHSFAKCMLSGRKYVGGIVGSGVAEDLSGDSSTVAGCYSMVDIISCEEFQGAISGVYAGNFVENFFVSDTLTGINERSYAGKAGPITYAKLLELAGTDTETVRVSIPEAFLQLSLTFQADGEVIKTVPFEYGTTFDETVYPEIPAKEGNYSSWDRTKLNELHFDTVVTAVYTPYVTALSNSEKRSDGRPIFFVEGLFDDEAVADVAALPNTPDDFSFLASGGMDFLKRSFSGTTVSREIVEQWRLLIPEDGLANHTVRYLAPDGGPENLDIYVKGTNGWQKTETELIGSYLVFSVEGSDAEIAVISTMKVWWVWLIVGTLSVLLLLLMVRLIHRIVKTKKRPYRKRGAKEITVPALPGKKKKRWVTPLLIVLALFSDIVGTAAYFLLPDLLKGKKAYDLLQTYCEKQKLTMELNVDAALGSQDVDFTAKLDRTDVDGHRVTAISQDDRTLYYCDGTVFLENGSAYKLSNSFPDYSQLLDHTMELYRHVELDEKDGIYSITVENADTKAILELLMPSAAGLLSDTNTMQAELVTNGEEVSRIRFSGSGALNDSTKTNFEVLAELELDTNNQDRIPIPEAVRNAVANGEYETAETITDDVVRMARAWQTLNDVDSIGAKINLKADCGPVTMDDVLDYYRWNDDGVQIASIRKNGYALYFTDTAICNQSGSVLQAAQADTAEAAKLLKIAYQICLNAEADCSQVDGKYTYSLSLDEDGMKAVAYAVAPAAEGMDLLFDSGSLQLVISDDQIESIEIHCGGTVRIVLSYADVAFEERMVFTEGTDASEIPEAVRKTLEQ
ncbi:MAG: GLUG motif-containing protein [Fusicatenibacter sp.]